MILLRLISLSYLRKHLFRGLLTMAGIVLGVAVFVGMHTANQSVLFAFYQTVERIAGATQLQISAGGTGFPESVLERVQSIPEVRVAVPIIEASVESPFEGQGSILILAVDMTGDRSLRDYDLDGGDAVIDDPLVFLAQPDSLIVTASFAERHGLGINSKIPMQTMAGEKRFTIRGIMKTGGLTSAFGGNLAIMDVYAAQLVFGRGRTFDRIDVGVQDGLPVEDVQKKLKRVLGPGYEVEAPSARGQQFESLSRIYANSANITSLFALFIGMFIIFNTFSIAVAQRRGEIGILRALGATRAQIRTLFLSESIVIGIAGSLAGTALGVLIARGMAGYVGGMLGEIYGVAQRAEELTASPILLAGALVIGVLTSVVAAVIPARNAARVDPVKALQKGAYQSITERESRVRRRVALAAALGAAACVGFSQYRAVFYSGYLLTIVAALLLAPSTALWLSRFLRPALKLARPVEGTLAADSLIQAPRRTSGTVAALMLSLALVISLGGVTKASYESIRQWMNIALNPDFFVGASESLTSRSFRFPPSIGDGIRDVEGVAEVQAVRTGRVLINGRPVMLVAADVAAVSQRTKLPAIAGNQQDMYRKAARGEGVIVSDNFSRLHGYNLNDTIEIAAPGKLLRLPVAGIVTDYSDQQGSILMERSIFQQHWQDETVDVFRVYLHAGADPDAVKQRILDRYGNQRRLFVMSNQQVREYILRLTDQWFGLTYVQIFVAVLVAVLGIVNSLTVSITDRKRELGVLQAVGGLRNQVRHTIWMEAVAIGIIGLVLGFALGAIQLWYSLEVSRRDLAGISLSYEYPFGIAAALLPMILGAAFLSAVAPAESAVRGSLVEALEYE